MREDNKWGSTLDEAHLPRFSLRSAVLCCTLKHHGRQTLVCLKKSVQFNVDDDRTRTSNLPKPWAVSDSYVCIRLISCHNDNVTISERLLLFS